MRHAKKGRKIGTDASHRTAILKGLTREVFEHERIETTETKAKEVRSMIDKVVGLAKRGDVHARRQALVILGSRDLVHKVFEEIPGRYEERQGGYTRVLKLGPRPGDGAPVAIIELV